MGQAQLTAFLSTGERVDPDGTGPVFEVPIANPDNLQCLHYPHPQTGEGAFPPAAAGDASADYFDDDDDSVHEDDINASAEAGFTDGRGGGYQPEESVQRDAMASFLARTLDLLVEEETTPAMQ